MCGWCVRTYHYAAGRPGPDAIPCITLLCPVAYFREKDTGGMATFKMQHTNSDIAHARGEIPQGVLQDPASETQTLLNDAKDETNVPIALGAFRDMGFERPFGCFTIQILSLHNYFDYMPRCLLLFFCPLTLHSRSPSSPLFHQSSSGTSVD